MVIMKKISLIVFLIFSLLMIGYGIVFIMDYLLVIKYSIEDCLPLQGDSTFPTESDRLNEIHALINYAKIVIIYAVCGLLLTVYCFFNINKNKDTN